MPKQIRFAQLVKTAGRPHAATLWVADSKEDAAFKKAVADNRVVSIRNVNVGSKKESGEIGYIPGKGVSYLLFDKALLMAEGTRVIGLKFEELAEVRVPDPVKLKEPPRKSHIERVKTFDEPERPAPGKKVAEEKQAADVKSPKPPKKAATQKEKAEKPGPTVSKFLVTVEFTARFTGEVDVEAANAAAAMELAVGKGRQPTGKVKWDSEAVEVKRRR